MDLWIRFHIWNGGSHLHIGYMETYTLQKLKDAADEVVQHGILEQLEARFMHCSQLFMPIWAAGHWVLLQASQETHPGVRRFSEWCSIWSPPEDRRRRLEVLEALAFLELDAQPGAAALEPSTAGSSGVRFLRGHVAGEDHAEGCRETVLPDVCRCGCQAAEGPPAEDAGGVGADDEARAGRGAYWRAPWT